MSTTNGLQYRRCVRTYLPVSSRLILGTAQFGLPYGVANRSGLIDRTEAAKILNLAWSEGIDTLDTAAAYGESERRLGEIGVRQWRIVSKLPAVPESAANVGAWVRTQIATSLRLLGTASLYGLLLHRPQQLLEPVGKALYRALLEAKDRGEVTKIGVSIYAPEDLDALGSHFKLDLVQGPLNIFDRRLSATGWLAKLHSAGVEVHIRSIFLQGLLLMDPVTRPARFNAWQPLWDQWHRWLEEQSITPLQACMGFGLSQSDVDGIVVGVDSLLHLEGILESMKRVPLPPPEHLKTDDLELINPSRWSKH
jgi:aryl-alcohol dehydrogenase-like predicted oxidoreductase